MTSAKTTRCPKYQELADMLINEITTSSLSVGEKLPGEQELVWKYGVSRYTVRAALRILEDLGIVSRRRGRGTFLTSKQPFRMYQQTIRSIQDMTQLPENCRRQLVQKDVVQTNHYLAKLLGCPVGTKWGVYSLIRADSTNTEPLCWQDIYVKPALERSCKWMLNESGVGSPHDYAKLDSLSHKTIVDVRATRIREHMAAPLKVATDGPALVITRRYIDKDDVPYCISVLHDPADRFTYSFELARERVEIEAGHSGYEK